MDDEALEAVIRRLAADVAEMRKAFDAYMPMLRAYLDPDQEGPRGWYMRRQLAKSNGKG